MPLRFFSVSHFAILVTEAILTGLFFLFYFETTQHKDRFDTNLVKMHSTVIEILSFSCFALFPRPPWNAKLQKSKMPSYKKHSGTNMD